MAYAKLRRGNHDDELLETVRHAFSQSLLIVPLALCADQSLAGRLVWRHASGLYRAIPVGAAGQLVGLASQRHCCGGG